MTSIRFYTHSLASKGHKELKKELKERGHNVLSLKKTGSSYRYNPNHLVINWGFRRSPHFSAPSSHFLNGNVEGLQQAADKLLTFKAWEQSGGIRAPLYTETIEEAEELFMHGSKVYCRTMRTASQGNGIVVAGSPEELVPCSLYTQGINLKHEYRLHVFKGQVIDKVMKRKMRSERREEEGITLNMDVRNHDNGWVFAREGLVLPDGTEALAIAATEALSLDFAAIDLVTDQYNVPYVIEANTAPGLVGTTTQSYSSAIEEYMETL